MGVPQDTLPLVVWVAGHISAPPAAPISPWQKPLEAGVRNLCSNLERQSRELSGENNHLQRFTVGDGQLQCLLSEFQVLGSDV